MNTDPNAPPYEPAPEPVPEPVPALAAVSAPVRSTKRELTIVLAVVLGILALFCAKAFTIDDPLFLWLGKHLQSHPLDFYGFAVDWDLSSQPMHAVTKNPPLTGYYIAAVAAVFGWSEAALHLAFLVPTGFAVAGTYLLARRFCAQPLLAALIGLFTPVFLVSSTNVMCDTMMLAFWCWSIWCWIEGFDRGRWTWFLWSAVLAALAGLTKYFGVNLLPLLAVYGVCRTRRLGAHLLFLLVPAAAFAGYQLWTQHLYGRGLLLDAAQYASALREVQGVGRVQQTWVGLVFAGGCLVPALFFAPLLWSWRWIVATIVVSAAAWYFVVAYVPFVGMESFDLRDLEPPVAAQLFLLSCGGISLLALTLADIRRNRDAESLLLCLWMLGTFVFAAYMNWVNNGRSNLPMASVLGILVVRRLGATGVLHGARSWACFGVSAVLALLVAYGDFRWANNVRSSVEEIRAQHISNGRRTLFLGHWGFQYYMQLAGAVPLDVVRDELEKGELVVVPNNNTGVFPLPESSATPVTVVQGPPQLWVMTVSPHLWAQFYASNGGFMPFTIGRNPPDTYRVLEVKRRSRIVDSRSGG
jgi:4-amino-4-deoxy-L-arabinose transferase-like glycosyltransferase